MENMLELFVHPLVLNISVRKFSLSDQKCRR